MTLVVNVNSNFCRFYHYHKHPAKLVLLKEFNQPENKLKNSDLTTDKAGNFQGYDAGGSAYEPRMDPKKVKVNDFLRQIAHDIEDERNKHQLEKLILIAPPQISGLLFQHLNKHTMGLIINHIQKDLFYLKDHELITYLQTHAEFPDPIV